jgi:hypothetical protein
MTSIVCITASTRKGWSSISVDVAYAEQLRSYLHSLKLVMTPSRDSVPSGKVIAETLRKTFDVQATPTSLERVVGHWCGKLAQE